MEIALTDLRIGFGTDIHRLENNGRPLILGGIAFHNAEGLGPVSHSDGDAVVHALIDAILGATCNGDIGRHFPDTDPSYGNADSMDLLKQATKIASRLHIINIDVVVHCDRPKIAPKSEEMTLNLASCLGLSPSAISIKAKTLEGLKFTPDGTIVYVTVALLGYLV